MSIFNDNEIGYVTFKRTYARRFDPSNVDSQVEEWHDCMYRLIRGCREIGTDFTREEEIEFRELLSTQKCIMAGRFLFQLGTCNIATNGMLTLQNCAGCVVDNINTFAWSMSMLLLGVGVGFNIQREYTDKLPVVHRAFAKRKDTNDADFIVPDNREGWVSLLSEVIRTHFSEDPDMNRDFTYSTILLRSKGAVIKGFGGTGKLH